MRPTASHFELSMRGHRPRAGRIFRPRSRTKINGHAMQKRLPTASRPMTVNARQCVQGSTPARFIGLISGPSRPSSTIAAARSNAMTWSARRKYRERIMAPRTGTRTKSNGVGLPLVRFAAIAVLRSKPICEGRTIRFGDKNWTAMRAAGTINAIDPGTHMMAPAAA